MTAWFLLILLVVGIVLVLRLARPRDDLLRPPPNGSRLTPWRRSVPWK